MPGAGESRSNASSLDLIRQRHGRAGSLAFESEGTPSNNESPPGTLMENLTKLRNRVYQPGDRTPSTPAGPVPSTSSERPDRDPPAGSTPPLPPPPPTDPKKFEAMDDMYDVNDVIEMAGWGRYQYKVVLVMGIMSFADAAEIWLATIIIKNLKCEWNLTSFQKAMIPAIVYIFYAFGSITSGRLADKFGRFWVLLINSYVLVISAVCSAFAPSYYFFIVCRAITGFCIGGNYGCSIVYAQEIMPTTKRSWNMFILAMFWTGGSIYECVVAFFVMQYHEGWRLQILLTAVPVAIMLVLMHFMDESPRFLVINGRKEEAQAVIEKICRENEVEVPKGDIFVEDVRNGEYSDIWARPHTCGSIQITVHFVCNMFLVFGISMLIPDMMTYNYCSMDMFFDSTYVDETGCTVYTKAEYLFLIVVALMYIPGMLGGTVSAEKMGRRWTFIVAIYAGAAATVVLLICLNSYLTYGELFACVIFYAAYNEVLWIYTPEFYATYMRGTAIGVQNGIGKLGAAAGTFLTTYLDEFDVRYSVYCFIAVEVVACVTIFFMKKETRGQVLQDTRMNEDTAIIDQEQGNSYGME